MTFWEFANNHEIITLICVVTIAESAAKMVKHACGRVKPTTTHFRMSGRREGPRKPQ